MKYEKNRIKTMMIFIFVFIFLVITAIFIGVKISKENAQRKEEVRIADIKKRYDEYRKEYRKLYHSHENEFAYIQKSIFSEPISKGTSFTTSLKENQLTFFIKNDSLEGQKLKDKLLQDEEFIRCAKDILNTAIGSISLLYTSYRSEDDHFVLTFGIPNRDELFVYIVYDMDDSNYREEEKIASNWYLVTRGKV